MDPARASESAKGVAAHRAMEAEEPAELRILDDGIARAMLGDRWTVIGVSRLPHRVALWISERFAPGLHDYLVARARFIDDLLIRAMEGGVTQLVILGAGFDSRPYRIPGLADRARVFELDRPASQREKLEALSRALGEVPGHVTFIPVDLGADAFAERLLAAGYDAARATMFVLEGLTMYLRPGAVDEALASIRSLAGAGSSVVFDYTYPEVLAGTHAHRTARNLKRRMDRNGEPFAFAIARGGAGRFLAPRGFELLQDVDHEGLDRAYFAGRRRGACPIFSVAHAAVSR
ncbi:MAG TPA: class I SAM-dependent methyltransferase [Anaeromyxobacteraceae bacterium]|nr:class I SAM-dependent methyltransferase [Anaeromyxobacteraceae bacterium]